MHAVELPLPAWLTVKENCRLNNFIQFPVKENELKWVNSSLCSYWIELSGSFFCPKNVSPPLLHVCTSVALF